MGAEFYDLSMVKDSNTVGIAHGGDAVRNEDGGAPPHDFTEVVEDLVFGVGVDAGECVVENQNPRIANQGAGNGSALFLAAGEGDAQLTNPFVVAIGQADDEVVDARRFCGRSYPDEVRQFVLWHAGRRVLTITAAARGRLYFDLLPLLPVGVAGPAAPDLSSIDMR